MDVVARLESVRARLASACERAGRAPESVRLLAVAKTKPAELVGKVAAAGQTLVGENYVQELLTKQPELPETIEWHFIGKLQSNKIRQLVGKVALIHSIDRAKLLKELDKRSEAAGLTTACLLEINVGDESGKGGASFEQAEKLVRMAAELPNVDLRGLMSIPPFLDDAEAMRPFHRHLYDLREKLQDKTGLALPELSMGMSLDMDTAVEEGATIVRVGTDIFGPRDYSGT